MMSGVSVVVSVYDSYDRAAILKAVLDRWRTQSIAPEVILSEQTPGASRWEPLTRTLGIRLVTSRPDRSGDAVRYDIGRVRNAGILAARGAFLYVTDADVYPLKDDYLERLLAAAVAAPNSVFYRPRMFRLLEAFIKAFLDFTAPIERPAEDGCLCSFTDGRIELVPEERRDIEGWDYVCTPAELALLQSETFDRRASEWIMKPDCHWGGTFLPRDGALRVGGFSEGYYGWAYEDEDFHTKLSALFRMAAIRDREVVHFEHPRPYNNNAFVENERRYLERVQAGALTMIEADHANPNSLMYRMV